MVRQLQLRPSRSSNKRLTYLRGRLLAQRSELQGRLTTWLHTREQTSGLSGDVIDMACKGLELETNCQLVSAESEAISEINQALHRIDNGTYGVCEICGKTIPYPRLRVLPFASLCVQCQGEQELARESEQTADREWEDTDGFDRREEVYATVRGTNRF